MSKEKTDNELWYSTYKRYSKLLEIANLLRLAISEDGCETLNVPSCEFCKKYDCCDFNSKGNSKKTCPIEKEWGRCGDEHSLWNGIYNAVDTLQLKIAICKQYVLQKHIINIRYEKVKRNE